MLINSQQLSVTEISHRLGHSNPDTTLKTYSHLYDEKKNKMSNLIDDFQKNMVKKWSENE